MLTLKERRKASAHINNQPTLTDQSAASQTDLNIIVNQFLKTGQSNSRSVPRYGDFTGIPQDLRGIIETSRSVQRLRGNLPEKLKGLSVQELLALTPEQINAIINPPAPKPDDKKDDKQS